MFDIKPLGEWMRHYGYEWIPGQERLLRGTLTASQALDLMQELHMEGAIRFARR